MTAYQIPTEFLNTNPNSKATFRPGGDAQFVSYLLGGIINEIADFGPERLPEGDTFETYIERVIVNESMNLGFSDALKVKFLNAARRILQNELDRQERKLIQAAKKAAKATKAEIQFNLMGGHLAKKGRWTYPVAEGTDGKVYRNENRDGSGAWILLQHDDGFTVIDA